METNSGQWKLVLFLETKTERQIETNSDQRKLIHTKLHIMHMEIKTRPENHMIFMIWEIIIFSSFVERTT